MQHSSNPPPEYERGNPPEYEPGPDHNLGLDPSFSMDLDLPFGTNFTPVCSETPTPSLSSLSPAMAMVDHRGTIIEIEEESEPEASQSLPPACPFIWLHKDDPLLVNFNSDYSPPRPQLLICGPPIERTSSDVRHTIGVPVLSEPIPEIEEIVPIALRKGTRTTKKVALAVVDASPSRPKSKIKRKPIKPKPESQYSDTEDTDDNDIVELPFFDLTGSDVTANFLVMHLYSSQIIF